MQGPIKVQAPGITEDFFNSSIEMNQKSTLKYKSCKNVKRESKIWTTICQAPDRVNTAQIFWRLEPLQTKNQLRMFALYDNVLNLIGLDIGACDVQQSIAKIEQI